MNHFTFRSRVESLMVNYMNYLSSCGDLASRMQILEEINKLSEIITQIDNMPAALAKTDVVSYLITLESKINE